MVQPVGTLDLVADGIPDFAPLSDQLEKLSPHVWRVSLVVVIGSLQAGRSFAQPAIAPAAIAYYAQLANHARLEYHVSPFSARSRAVPFSFDWSIDYYPGEYANPGPEMSVYRLTGGKCAPNYSPKRR